MPTALVKLYYCGVANLSVSLFTGC